MTLTTERPRILKPTIDQEATALAERLLRMLSSVLKRSSSSGDSRPLKTAEDWIKTTKSGRGRFKYIHELFITCIQLRDKLPLSERYYELYYPASFDDRFIEGKLQSGIGGVDFCLSPAIVEFDPDMFVRERIGASVMHGAQNFIHATEEQRRKGRLVCRARVTQGEV